MQETKRLTNKSEVWLSAISSIGALATAYVSHLENAATWVALAVCLLLTGVYAFFHTPLAAKDRPGVKTKAFWTSVVVVVGSVVTALAESDVAGVPARITQIAGMISAGLTAVGYHVWRYTKKSA